MRTDPRRDPYRLRAARPRWWRPWWTVRVDYLDDWASHGDQTIVVVRSRDAARARGRAVLALIDHCQWLARQPWHRADTFPVLWQGAEQVTVEVARLQVCSYCAKPAVVDAETSRPGGRWAFMCAGHWAVHGLGLLGDGHGQWLVLAPPLPAPHGPASQR